MSTFSILVQISRPGPETDFMDVNGPDCKFLSSLRNVSNFIESDMIVLHPVICSNIIQSLQD